MRSGIIDWATAGQQILDAVHAAHELQLAMGEHLAGVLAPAVRRSVSG